MLLKGARDKRVRELLKFLSSAGCEVGLTSGGHVKIERCGRIITTAACTPSDHRAYLNLKARLRRALPAVMEGWTK